MWNTRLPGWAGHCAQRADISLAAPMVWRGTCHPSLERTRPQRTGRRGDLSASHGCAGRHMAGGCHGRWWAGTHASGHYRHRVMVAAKQDAAHLIRTSATSVRHPHYPGSRSAGRRAPATSLSTIRAAATMPKVAVTIITAPKPPAQSSFTPSPTKALLWHTLPSGVG